jgi:hypothetical protein
MSRKRVIEKETERKIERERKAQSQGYLVFMLSRRIGKELVVRIHDSDEDSDYSCKATGAMAKLTSRQRLSEKYVTTHSFVFHCPTSS